jgi:uncharacterized RmlC-like cupin family protein
LLVREFTDQRVWSVTWMGGGWPREVMLDPPKTFSGRSTSREKTLALSPHCESLASAIASASVANICIVNTGPNTSSWTNLHNIDETIIVFKGEYKIRFGDPSKDEYVIVKSAASSPSRQAPRTR